MGKDEKSVSDILLKIPLMRYAVVTVSLPAVSLAYCFISSVLFRIDEVNDTDCNVTNTIPSVSAVTGITPQAYIWRFCIGLHAAPRFFVGIAQFNRCMKRISVINKKYRSLYKGLVHLVFWLYTIECACLQMVSCISNKENYPIHEKIFIVFMTASIADMLFNTIAYRWSHPGPLTNDERKSYLQKRLMLVWISLSTVGLLVFFVRHRFYCIPGAFSWFSVFEYMIAYANMGYHFTARYDFDNKFFIMADLAGEQKSSNGVVVKNGKVKRN